MAGIEARPEDIQDVYDRQAAVYDAQRSRALFEARWLARFAACLPANGHVLDLGCGAGEPIARWFLSEGFALTGLDFSIAMLDIARSRWPSGDWRQGDMRDFALPERFDGIVAWDSFFHLTGPEQRDVIARIGSHLKPGGSLLLTVGPAAGEVQGTVGGEPVYHASLSPADYAACLEDNGLILTGFLSEDPETDRHSVLMARKL
ncbi:class I SAM-dependent methyltransferase [Mesobacterium sp. TK19101]|uniref:Class I SAM-dependent methyltransferase n=1 Tax=Mesobacterium hydrothermale TaxID=3111907 RepID=A0ABU6HJT2_9RHOB|nr:class I SAM-dependent methyltransferase [Mesobacterium sp. TK19101]MEC3862627.1 class I SAM-dependent methyltransferase [Mesobacterium sp. TK19101]